MVMAKVSKSADAARAAYKAKKAAPKGGGKAASGMNLYTPVKQTTINKIKTMGMTAALKKAGTSSNAEFVQGVKRMYGADRLKKAMAANKPAAKSADAARAGSMNKPVRPVAKSADEARMGASKSKTVAKKPAPKYTSKSPKPMNPKGLFPGLLGGKK
jgi:hypothetical protein